MLTRLTLFASFAVLLAPQILAHLVFPQREVIARSPAPLDLISAYTADVSKRETTSSDIQDEHRGKRPGGPVIPHPERDVPVEVPVDSPDGTTIPYGKRRVPDKHRGKKPGAHPERDVPVEVSDEHRGKKHPGRDVAIDVPVDSPDETTIPYGKRRVPDEHRGKKPGAHPERDVPVEVSDEHRGKSILSEMLPSSTQSKGLGGPSFLILDLSE
ncbi:uncharacterized protein EV420DRAFT_1637046 [Desarmillaria tabescens]|uniref:Uncharacterized protein n=1 Tax=Armillaria tabescens TaxID=1929756 RepID=A0AA39NG59_ARMTA|nr:uncharacterized protein EV420DRAFT_1637046 [Desarmillaria tabescens]KAK0464873.1 hypothetical protein EV420DRAFT_1637046 [Desarmillaria tabescens]